MAGRERYRQPTEEEVTEAGEIVNALAAKLKVLGSENDPRKFSFNRDAVQVASDLVGATIIVDQGIITIQNAQAWPASEIKNKNQFGPAMDAQPGTITAVNNRGKAYPNITVGERGLVLVRAFTLQSGEGDNTSITSFDKPIRFAEQLGLSIGDARTLSIEDPYAKTLRLSPTGESPQPQQ